MCVRGVERAHPVIFKTVKNAIFNGRELAASVLEDWITQIYATKCAPCSFRCGQFQWFSSWTRIQSLPRKKDLFSIPVASCLASRSAEELKKCKCDPFDSLWQIPFRHVQKGLCKCKPVSISHTRALWQCFKDESIFLFNESVLKLERANINIALFFIWRAREKSTQIPSAGCLPKCTQQPQKSELSQGLLDKWSNPSFFSHHHCLPGLALVTSWRQDLELRIKPRDSTMGYGCCNQHLKKSKAKCPPLLYLFC